MPYREVTMLEVKEVLRLWLGGMAKKAIAAQLGLDVKTVRRYLRAAKAQGMTEQQGSSALTDTLLAAVLTSTQPASGRQRGAGWAVCEQHRTAIESYLRGRVRLSKIRKLLRRQGVEISYPTLRRFAIAELGFGRGAATIPVADCGPGEELQVDTGWVGHLVTDLFGRKRRFRAWIFTAVLSRHRFVYPVWQESTQTAIEACEAAWEFFGGVFKALIVDNTKAIVQKADPLDPRLTRAFLEYAQARGFVVDTTRVRKPQDKARTERAIQTVRDDCFGGEKLYALEAARDHAQNWCLREYGMRRHSTTLRLPLEHFESVERPALLPAPTEPFDIPLWSDPKVARDQYAQVQKALYSLPDDLIGKTLSARADRSTVRLYQGTVLRKTHPRMAPGKRSTDPNDFPKHKSAYALRDVEFLAREASKHGEAIGRFARALLAGELPWTRMRRVYALLGLVRRFGAQRVEAACEQALAVELIDVYRLRRLIELAQPQSSPTALKVLPLARFLRPASQYALPLAAARQRDRGEES